MFKLGSDTTKAVAKLMAVRRGDSVIFTKEQAKLVFDYIIYLEKEVEKIRRMFDNVMDTMNVDYEDMFPEDDVDE